MKTEMHYLYEIKFKNGFYIGRTENPKQREQQHRLKPSGALLEYQKQNNEWKFISFDVIYKASYEEIADLEGKLIKELDCINKIRKIREHEVDLSKVKFKGQTLKVLQFLKLTEGKKISSPEIKKELSMNICTIRTAIQRLKKYGYLKVLESYTGAWGYSVYKVVNI